MIAVNANELARYYGSMNAMTLVPSVTGAMAVEGSKKVISTTGREAAAVIALLLIGAGVALWLSEPGGRMRESATKLAHEIGSPLAEAATRARARWVRCKSDQPGELVGIDCFYV